MPNRMHSPSFQYRRCSLRFRRWSRRNYAAFVSLGREVLIGHLRCDVADCSMLKLKHHLHADGGCGMARTAGDDGSGYPPDVGPDVGLVRDGISVAGSAGCGTTFYSGNIREGAAGEACACRLQGRDAGRMRWFADERRADLVCLKLPRQASAYFLYGLAEHRKINNQRIS